MDTTYTDAAPGGKSVGLDLTKALEAFIIPLIRGTDNDAKQYEENACTLDPLAKDLVAAFKAFVSHIATGPKCRGQKAIEVKLEEEKQAPRGDYKHFGEEVAHSRPQRRSLIAMCHDGHQSRLLDPIEKQLAFHKKLICSLREHVFNSMPIRLLRFRPHKSGFQILLLERDAIHAEIEAILRVNIHREDHYPHLSQQGRETDDEAIKRLISRYAKYAILSHTWSRSEAGEVTYGDWNTGQLKSESPGYQKLINFCKITWTEYGVGFGWIDTICINKESSSELDESIRSMYNWYARSQLCIVYLASTHTLSDMYSDPWFTRGWTLQELLAPFVIKFYNGNWQQFVAGSDNDKGEPQITYQIEKATTISTDELRNIHWAPISRRLQLAANRQVTREEDIAYSLMGIFNVSITTAYGEGAKRAFFRLLQEVLSTSVDVLDIFNGASKVVDNRAHPSGILASSPRHYLKRSCNPLLSLRRPMEPLTLTHVGLRVPTILMPASAFKTGQYHPVGDFNAIMDIKYECSNGVYKVLDRLSYEDKDEDPNSALDDSQSLDEIMLAVVNCSREVGDGRYTKPGSIFIPEMCLAIPLRCREKVGKVTNGRGNFQILETSEPVVFQLHAKNHYLLSRFVHQDKLKNQGMQLVTLYL
ncbi:HET-domain-containing protein [Pholiota conissans]|uniref:HET-domain-containing protein n=1 Tax=Pholiota conissans TaxID=109636 RepID=A0A9P5YSM7_9AGAR|nr:HET-domain-containing protein [Pholiota conissans]